MDVYAESRKLSEEPIGGILRKQDSITRLFPPFYDRVDQVAGAGGVKLVKEDAGVWYFKVTSATTAGLKYDVTVQFADIRKIIAKEAQDMRNWKKDKSGVDARRLGAAVVDQADLKILCSCLTGDTKVPLLDGRVLTMEEMLNEYGTTKTFWIYSSDEHGDFTPKKARCLGVTGITSHLIEVTLDNGKTIKSTVDHLYRMRDGTYKRAEEIKTGDSLMPLYMKLSKNKKFSQQYLQVKYNSKVDRMGRPIFKMVHRIVAETVLKDQYDKKYELVRSGKEKWLTVHHKNFNTLDNRPENQGWMGRLEHWYYHARLGKQNVIKSIEKARNDPQFRKEMSIRNANAGRIFAEKRPDVVKHFNEKGVAFVQSAEGRKFFSAQMKNMWKNPKNRESIIKAGQNRKISEETRERMKEASAKRWACSEEIARASAVTTERNKAWPRDPITGKFLKMHNHKVVKITIIDLDKEVPVYDLFVEDSHNFLVAAGVFVHNCPSFQYWGPAYTTTQRGTKYGEPENRPPRIRNPKQYGIMCKHSQLMFDVIPFYKSTMAGHIKRFFMKDVWAAEKGARGAVGAVKKGAEFLKGKERAKESVNESHSHDKCMECDKPPTKEVKWAEGMAHAWFCDEHFKSWSVINGGDIDYVKEIKDGVASKKFADNPNPNIHKANAQESVKEGDKVRVKIGDDQGLEGTVELVSRDKAQVRTKRGATFTYFIEDLERLQEADASQEEKEKYFEERTAKHIALVQAAAKRLEQAHILNGADCGDLMAQVEHHDASKLEEPERTPYIKISWRHKQDNFKSYKTPGTLPDEDENKATERHIFTNKHHPEYWSVEGEEYRRNL
jgi:ribosomal protein L24